MVQVLLTLIFIVLIYIAVKIKKIIYFLDKFYYLDQDDANRSGNINDYFHGIIDNLSKIHTDLEEVQENIKEIRS